MLLCLLQWLRVGQCSHKNFGQLQTDKTASTRLNPINKEYWRKTQKCITKGRGDLNDSIQSRAWKLWFRWRLSYAASFRKEHLRSLCLFTLLPCKPPIWFVVIVAMQTGNSPFWNCEKSSASSAQDGSKGQTQKWEEVQKFMINYLYFRQASIFNYLHG
jgi:hypothetical protein